MSEFVNTVDIIGDEALIDSIIDRSVTEIKDNIVSKLGEYALYGCTNLTAVNLPAVTSITLCVFDGCTNLTAVNLPAVTSIGDYAFRNCAAVTTLDFPVATSVGILAFANCSALTAVNIPLLSSIGSNPFNGAASLVRVRFDSVETIAASYNADQGAFGNCTKLEFADFPVLKTLGNRAFLNCSSLRALILRSETMATLDNTTALNSTPIKSGTGYIYVPAALVDSYKAASNWSTYANQFRALEDYTVDGTITGELDETKI